MSLYFVFTGDEKEDVILRLQVLVFGNCCKIRVLDTFTWLLHLSCTALGDTVYIMLFMNEDLWLSGKQKPFFQHHRRCSLPRREHMLLSCISPQFLYQLAFFSQSILLYLSVSAMVFKDHPCLGYIVFFSIVLTSFHL